MIVMARIDRATRRGTAPRRIARSGRAMTRSGRGDQTASPAAGGHAPPPVPPDRASFRDTAIR